MSGYSDTKQKRRGKDHPVTGESSLTKKYFYFRRLLGSNNRALEIISDLEQVIYQDKPFSFAHVLIQSELLMGEVFSIVEDINALSGIMYPELFDAMERVSDAVFAELRRKKKLEETSLVLPLERISLENISDVGGKAANLGEMYNRVHLPVPQGFAVTAFSCQQFMDYNNLTELTETRLRDLDVNDTETLIRESNEIRSLILKGELPRELEEAIKESSRELGRRIGKNFRLSVRSSATSEDSEASFAGQHSTVLNVREEGLIHAYKEVLSSAYNPRAVFYRRRKGYREQDVIMSVACIRMIDAKVSGVMYTVDPNDSRRGVILISAVWGLAVGVVEGSVTADFFQVNKKNKKIETFRVAPKNMRIRADRVEGLKEEILPYDLKNKPCLDSSQVQTLVDYSLRLERHYGYALDIEWAIDQDNRVYMLQTRPLRRSQAHEEVAEAQDGGRGFPGHPILLKGGESACDGMASGVAYVMESDHMLHHIPEGVVLIAGQTSPRYVPLMGRIQAIVTDVGSVAGHMASVAREFHIPTLVGTGSATKRIPHGMEITVDATNRIIYGGRVESRLKEKKPINPMKGSPIYKTVQAALKYIAPLNLADPKRADFSPEGCRTVHDIIRFSHEMAMQQMFRLGEDLEPEEYAAVPLRALLPMAIVIVDLGGGLSIRSDQHEAQFENIASVPFSALLTGMLLRGVSWPYESQEESHNGVWPATEDESGAIPKAPSGKGSNCAIIGKHYLNFNWHFGDYFSTIDTYCGPLVNDNYITFYFKGGAADIGRRSRRAQFVFMVIRELGFKVEKRGDMVRGEIKKYLSRTLEQKLDMLGRLLGCVSCLERRLAEEEVEWYVDQFFVGNYTLCADSDGGRSPAGLS